MTNLKTQEGLADVVPSSRPRAAGWVTVLRRRRAGLPIEPQRHANVRPHRRCMPGTAGRCGCSRRSTRGEAIAHAVLVTTRWPGGRRPAGHRHRRQPAPTCWSPRPPPRAFIAAWPAKPYRAVSAQVAAAAGSNGCRRRPWPGNGCDGRNGGASCTWRPAQLLAGEITSAGPAGSGQTFAAGRLLQHLEVPGLWLDRGWLAAQDTAFAERPGRAGQPPRAGHPGGRAGRPTHQAGGLARRQPPMPGEPAGVWREPAGAWGALGAAGPRLGARRGAGDLAPAGHCGRCGVSGSWGLAPCEPRVWAT